MSTILHIEDAQRLQRNPDQAYKPDIIDRYSRYSSGVYAPLQREGRFPDTRPLDQRIDTGPYQPSTYSELLELEASLPQRHLMAKVQVGVPCYALCMRKLPKAQSYQAIGGNMVVATIATVGMVTRLWDVTVSVTLQFALEQLGGTCRHNVHRRGFPQPPFPPPFLLSFPLYIDQAGLGLPASLV